VGTPPVIAVVGPTGSGKSDLAVNLALELDGEVINADAMQFYRGMDIGTAKITLPERRGVPHHLLDILDVTQEASVSDFQQQARQLIDEIHARGKRAILAGGSGLYVRAALDVLDFPGTDPQLRQQLEADLAASGTAAMLARLQAVDPASAARLSDDRRIIRALEVHQLTGRPFSSFMPRREYVQPAVQVGLAVDRDVLRERLAQRVHAMTGRACAAARQRPAPSATPSSCRFSTVKPPLRRRRKAPSWPPASSPAASSPGSGRTPGSAGWTGRIRNWWAVPWTSADDGFRPVRQQGAAGFGPAAPGR
jgi:tRNA dimethylallyltransferase